MQIHLLLQNGPDHYQITLPTPITVVPGQYLTTSSTPLLLWVAQVILGEGLTIWPLAHDHPPLDRVKERVSCVHPGALVGAGVVCLQTNRVLGVGGSVRSLSGAY